MFGPIRPTRSSNNTIARGPSRVTNNGLFIYNILYYMRDKNIVGSILTRRTNSEQYKCLGAAGKCQSLDGDGCEREQSRCHEREREKINYTQVLHLYTTQFYTAVWVENNMSSCYGCDLQLSFKILISHARSY